MSRSALQDGAAIREHAKMDLELWMQEDGTGISGMVLYACDIYDEGTIRNVAAHLLVRTTLGRLDASLELCACFQQY